MVFYATFNSISVISRRQLTLFMSFLGFTITRLGALKCLAQRHSHEKTQRIQCCSNPGPLDYESNTLPLSHARPLRRRRRRRRRGRGRRRGGGGGRRRRRTRRFVCLFGVLLHIDSISVM